MKAAEIALPALLFGCVLVLLGLGFFHYEYSWVTFAFPLGVGAALCVLCLVQIGLTLRRRETVPAGGAEEAEPLSLAAAAWMFGLLIFLYGLGFVFGIAAYLLVCLRAQGASWALALAVAAASLAVTWGLFIRIMGILLPVGPLWLGS